MKPDDEPTKTTLARLRARKKEIEKGIVPVIRTGKPIGISWKKKRGKK